MKNRLKDESGFSNYVGSDIVGRARQHFAHEAKVKKEKIEASKRLELKTLRLLAESLV